MVCPALAPSVRSSAYESAEHLGQADPLARWDGGRWERSESSNGHRMPEVELSSIGRRQGAHEAKERWLTLVAVDGAVGDSFRLANRRLQLEALHRKYSSRGLVLVGVNVGGEHPDGRGAGFAARTDRLAERRPERVARKPRLTARAANSTQRRLTLSLRRLARARRETRMHPFQVPASRCNSNVCGSNPERSAFKSGRQAGKCARYHMKWAHAEGMRRISAP